MFTSRLANLTARCARSSSVVVPAASPAACFSSLSSLDFRKEYNLAFVSSLRSGELGLLRAPGSGFASLTAEMTPPEKINFLFDEIDANNDGVLSLAEVQSAADKIGMSEEEAAALFASLDTDGDGELTRVKFSEIGATELTSLEGIAAFVQNSLGAVSGKSKPASHTGRWGVEFQPEQKGKKDSTYDHSA